MQPSLARSVQSATLVAAIGLSGGAAGAQASIQEGQELVAGVCTACHGMNQIERSMGYTEEGWRALIATMIDLEGTGQLEPITAFLAEFYPPNDRRAPDLVEGDVEIGFTEWVAPTLGQRSRDPVEAPDGSIWWAGMWADLAVRVDPETGEIREYQLPVDSQPHTVTTDALGNIWFTGNGNATMGRLDPETGEVTVYAMPDPAARDPHSAIVDSRGLVWFTLQRSNMVGRLDPASGEIDLVTMPTADSRPYGIKLSADETPWVAANGSNRLYRIDRKSMAVTEFELPDGGTTVRRLDFASDDTIWFVNSSLGRLGHLDPQSGEVREWPSPSGPDSHPYALAVIDDIVWYNESGKRPDTLVRFDPASETFQSWPIPSGEIYAGIVRHMRETRSGDLLIHQSSTNRGILVDIPEPVAATE